MKSKNKHCWTRRHNGYIHCFNATDSFETACQLDTLMLGLKDEVGEPLWLHIALHINQQQTDSKQSKGKENESGLGQVFKIFPSIGSYGIFLWHDLIKGSFFVR